MVGPAHGPYDDIGNIFRNQRLDALVDLGRSLLVAVEAHQAEVGFYHSGVHAGDANRRSQHVFAQAVVDGPLGGLAGAVDRAVGIGHLARHRTQVDYVSAATLHHSRHHGAGDVEQPFHISVDHLVPVFDLSLVELVEAAAEAGVIDQHVDGGPLRGQRIDGFLDGVVVAHIEGECVNGLGPALEDGGSYFSQLIDAASGEQQARAFGGKSESSGRANAGRGPGNENNLSLETHGSILTNRGYGC